MESGLVSDPEPPEPVPEPIPEPKTGSAIIISFFRFDLGKAAFKCAKRVSHDKVLAMVPEQVPEPVRFWSCDTFFLHVQTLVDPNLTFKIRLFC